MSEEKTVKFGWCSDMNNIETIIENIRKASAVEKKMGYKNAAVFGGFSTFVITCLDRMRSLPGPDFPEEISREMSQLETVMKNYQEDKPADREKAVQAASRLLDKMAGKMLCNSRGQADKPATPGNLQFLKSVGPKRVRLLNRLGIYTIKDILYHFPRRYEDRSNLKKFHQLQDGGYETVMGTVLGCQDLRPRKGLTITKAAIHDGFSTGYAVWFNQPFVKKQLRQGTQILITGKVERKFGNIQVSVADFEVMDKDDPVHSGRIVPVYPATEGLQARALRSILKSALDQYVQVQQEFIPEYLLRKYGFPGLPAALSKIHFPESMEDIEEARNRLVFEELFVLQLGVCMLKMSELQEKGIRHKKSGPLMNAFWGQIPFALTAAQKRVLKEIFADMEDIKPMNRLVQGDVGSGKTMVAAAALVKTVESGYQGALMAPTEVLALQHYEGLGELLEPLGIKTALLTGSMNKNEKNQTVDDIKNGRVDIVIGTHAVIQEEVEFQKLGLGITDEQHRFGVRQRSLLKSKGYNPDVLVMTATPIPRTLALTVYGDLDISVIDELPPGRQPVKTRWVASKTKDRVYRFIQDQVREGRQVFYVCPLVEESDKLDVQAAVELAETLQTKIFPDLSIGLMHGRLKQDAKDTVMREFKNGSIDILVATTVVEVGVNVPNATVMVIEDADRFGLAQLHQLRGRVGRGSHQSYCILLANPATEEGRARMDIMQSTCDGFVIAEEDLKLRGPGEFFGTRQSGLPDLKIADIIKDVRVLQTAREEAFKLVQADPALNNPQHALLKEHIIEKFKDTDNYIKTS